MKEIGKALSILAEGLKMLADGFKAISSKVDQIAKSHSKPNTVKAARRSTQKTSPVSNAASKPQRRQAAKKSPKPRPPKSDAGKTALETVSGLIRDSREGISHSALMEKTGFDKKKVSNVILKLKKRGHIRALKKGVYAPAE